MSVLKDITGQRFGRLAVISRAENRSKKAYWSCWCDCGNESVVRGGCLKRGDTRSCGCLMREESSERLRVFGRANSSFKHGLAHKTPEYFVWKAMRQRCNNSGDRYFPRYGGRGIKVCERWNFFENFIADMGSRPSFQHSIDRYPDNDGAYEPSNCRWATPIESAWSCLGNLHWQRRKQAA